MKTTLKYEKAINEMLREFTIKWYSELFQEEADELDIQEVIDGVIWGDKYGIWPLTICDQYLDIDTVFIALSNDIPMKVVSNWLDESLEAYQEKITMPNLRNYYKMNI